MRLLQIILYFIIGYLLWRMVKVVIRMITGSSAGRSSEASVKEGPSPKKSTKNYRMDQIKDAEFEDITPSDKQSRDSSH